MSSKSKNKQIFFWVITLGVIILFFWIFSWDYLFDQSNRHIDETGSWQYTVSSLNNDWQQFQQQLEQQSFDFQQLSLKLQQQAVDLQQRQKNIVDSVIYKIKQPQLENWQQYNDDNISFKYPPEWQVTAVDNITEFSFDGQSVLTLQTFDSTAELPDNINAATLEEWLRLQVDRELSIFTDYSLLDDYQEFEIYQVVGKPEQRDIFASQASIIYWFQFKTTQFEDTNNQDLIISSIK